MNLTIAELTEAHEIGLELVELVGEHSRLASAMLRGIPEDADELNDLNRRRRDLTQVIDRANSTLVPALVDFAALYKQPFAYAKIDPATSYHFVARELGLWVLERNWTADVFHPVMAKHFVASRASETVDAFDRKGARGEEHYNASDLYWIWDYRPADHRAQLEIEFARATVRPGDPIWIPELDFQEKCILEALKGVWLIGEELATKAGYDYAPKFRTLLSAMIKRGLLQNRPRQGYGWGPLADFALRQAELEQV